MTQAFPFGMTFEAMMTAHLMRHIDYAGLTQHENEV
jgi:hypothetical protein